jgi:hypothetical protein
MYVIFSKIQFHVLVRFMNDHLLTFSSTRPAHKFLVSSEFYDLF